ncbi:MAG: hypothetical protein NZ874_02835 [Fimbriimonadales bacterium]|nr:hypothetical protein [Fimbriimonadales bacterium]
MKSQLYGNRRALGRASCWLIGGLGCLGVIVILGVVLFLGGRAFFEQVVKPAMQIAEKGTPVAERQKAVYNALRQYASANNGKYPKSLKELTPKYLPADALAPIKLADGTQVQLVYKPPQPNAPANTVILEHKPALSGTMNILGTEVKINFTYEMQLNGDVYLNQEYIDPQGQKRTQRERITP